jgi:hypothetical protein
MFHISPLRIANIHNIAEQCSGSALLADATRRSRPRKREREREREGGGREGEETVHRGEYLALLSRVIRVSRVDALKWPSGATRGRVTAAVNKLSSPLVCAGRSRDL